MINYHTRKPIRDFLNRVTEPPYTLTREEQQCFFEAIMSVYEETANSARAAFLISDTFDLLRTFAVEDKAIDRKDPNDTHRHSMIEIRFMLATLIAAAHQLGVCLPETELQKHGYESLQFMGNNSFAQYVRETYEPTQPQKKADSSVTGTGMGNNATTPPQTPPATKETTQLSILPPYKPKPVGRPAGDFVKTIANGYTDKADIIQEHTETALANMTDPKAVITLFIVYFRKGILKQCPTYWQALRLLDIKGETNIDKESLCPFGTHHQFDRLRKIYFDPNDSYLSLNKTSREQDNDISSYLQAANNTYTALLAKLIPTPQKKARKGA